MDDIREVDKYKYPECMFVRERDTTEDGEDVYVVSLASKVIPEGETAPIAIVLGVTYAYGDINIDAETALSETFHSICIQVRRGEIVPDDYEEKNGIDIDILDDEDQVT